MKTDNFEDFLRKRIDDMLARETERAKRDNHEKNVASVIGFASRLVPLLRNGRNSSGKSRGDGGIKAVILRRGNDSLRDYCGTVAIAVLGNRFPGRKKKTSHRSCDKVNGVYVCTENSKQ